MTWIIVVSAMFKWPDKNKSIAEQNSLDLAWDLFMGPDFGLLRRAMFTDRSDMLRFRQIVVNTVLATDIFDKELDDLPKARWNKAFTENVGPVDNDLRATIVIEHIIQASDVSHTMQHWVRVFIVTADAALASRRI